ncbi:MAG: cytochrome-c oxidase, cbb3-type subunit I [Sulfurovum sp.]|nr:cytochrome-c oxidase, cbb3-type subunit I [Sulfurovum sp.]
MEKPTYNTDIVKSFVHWGLFWGLVAILIGVVVSLQMVDPDLNYPPYFTFGRLRPIHTNAGLFGWGFGFIFATFYFIVQRLCKIRIWSDKLATFQLWLFNITIIASAVTLLLGYNTTKEYHEMEWPIDILIVVLWVIFSANIIMTIIKRKEEQMYISLWYMMAAIIGVAILFLVNSAAVPVSLFKSYSAYAGTNDANVQWWFGHNAVAFGFTVPIVAMIYYFLPKESGQAVYSYKLSLLSFWGLMFVYLWAGSHHLLWSTVPDWMQTMGSIFSVVLILPSWGSAINMLLTMKGEWNQLTENPLIKFMVLASTFYMLSTLEGPIQAVKSVNAIAHFTDWIPGHVHDGVLGWVAFMIMAALFHMAPRMFKREIYSKKLIEAQFWIQTTAVVLYFTSMWIAGITQGMMWRAVDEYGNLMYSFIDTVTVLHPYYAIRALAGVLYVTGFVMFAYNMVKTMTSSRELSEEPQFRSPMA